MRRPKPADPNEPYLPSFYVLVLVLVLLLTSREWKAGSAGNKHLVIFWQNIEIADLCKGVNCVDLLKKFALGRDRHSIDAQVSVAFLLLFSRHSAFLPPQGPLGHLQATPTTNQPANPAFLLFLWRLGGSSRSGISDVFLEARRIYVGISMDFIWTP